MNDIIKGRKPVLTAIENNVSINKLFISKSAKGDIISTIFRLARKKGIVFSFLDSKEIDRKGGDKNQGVVAFVSATEYLSIDELLEIAADNKKNNKNTRFCILDSITDPHNVGAIIRSAYAFGIDGVIIPKRNCCPINSTVVKASAGSASLMNIANINNIVDTMKILKDNGFWCMGADIDGEDIKSFVNNQKDTDLCIVLGSEGKGMKRLVKENCDYIVKIPFVRDFDSLNVSCAASIIFYTLS